MAAFSEAEAPSPDIYIPEEWSEAAETIAYDSVTSPPPVALVCGAKNCGKTTFSRHLLNILLQRYQKVAYLDTDVGQTEFTPPGFLSLTVIDQLTPDLTIPCLKTPERCYYFGDISSKRDPTAYLNYIFALYDYYRREYCMLKGSKKPVKTELPLVVNTPGWVKGIGYDILVDVLKYIAPTHVVKINISAEGKNLPAGAFWLDGDHKESVNLIEVSSARQDSFKRSVLVQKDAGLLRDLRIMAYFRQCFPSNLNITTIKELAHALASHSPYEIPIPSIKIKHLHCQVPSTEILYSLNATIVGLAVSSEDSENLSPCVGLGIVRGIDTFKRLLYVLTPVPQSTLEKVDLLLLGFVQIPTCLLQVSGPLPTAASVSMKFIYFSDNHQ
ncbi:polynucleotide 5'-hydroxyl-kinase NOL9 isoform X1 [Vitis vinifera]|uniref:Polynucleotide 5'-hydroxyl-kinase NOL9 n=1 Tax=Vitis vinifera TaxID=29760 RepID=A0A438I3J2_VITVI|nr:polynucleotide 5'-hydroxyl-kinase NOL9 isoform X1 [Vitis vinifera]RVW91261.1 Polynucleotide 5'-hydroxyl-kinase NOL9 [Vitis vinifera]